MQVQIYTLITWPASARIAARLLTSLCTNMRVALLLSGRRKEGVQRSFAVTTNVDFAELSTAEIAAYIATGMCAANLLPLRAYLMQCPPSHHCSEGLQPALTFMLLCLASF